MSDYGIEPIGRGLGSSAGSDSLEHPVRLIRETRETKALGTESGQNLNIRPFKGMAPVNGWIDRAATK